MIRNLIRRLFINEKKRIKILKDLKSNDSFRTREEILNGDNRINEAVTLNLKKGEIKSIYSPDLGNQRNLVLTKWYYKPGDLVTSGDIICDIENENIVMEFESLFSGKLLSTCNLNQKLTKGTEIFKIIGV
tara:strand:+ start:487 stop:879 length:393 start_codon:yes stop_codon:yes gene_type:complete